MYRAGDTITIGANPTVELAKFTFVKPSASVSRTLLEGEDPAEVMAEMQTDLREALARSVLVEVGEMNELTQAYDDGGTDGLARYCNNIIGAPNGTTRQSQHSAKPAKRGRKSS